MKKIIALLLTLVLVLGFAACGEAGSQNEAPTPTPTEEAKTPETVGEKIYADFKADHSGTAQEIAERLLQNEVIQFMSGAISVEEGYLNGFDNAEIKGFKEGVMFGPMMGSIPFVGYIFVLEDGADVNAFKTTLKDNANLRWQISVEAEELIVENEGNVVFFLMCPRNFETPETDNGVGDMGVDGDMGIDGDMGVEGELPAYDGETVGEVTAE